VFQIRENDFPLLLQGVHDVWGGCCSRGASFSAAPPRFVPLLQNWLHWSARGSRLLWVARLLLLGIAGYTTVVLPAMSIICTQEKLIICGIKYTLKFITVLCCIIFLFISCTSFTWYFSMLSNSIANWLFLCAAVVERGNPGIVYEHVCPKWVFQVVHQHMTLSYSFNMEYWSVNP